MKSKRRHELQTNDLADRIGHVIERVRPYMTTALAVLVAFAVVISAYYYLAANREHKMANAWRAYFSAGADPASDATAQLSDVADNYADTPAGLWAAQTAADLSLSQGIRMLFSDRAAAETNIAKAKGLYKQVLDNKLTKSYAMLLERARFGLAQAHETLNELKEARKLYQLVIDMSPDSPLGKAAKSRLDRLEDPKVEKWYNWFARQEPAPPPPPAQQPGSTLGGSPLGSGLPNLSGLSDMPDADVTTTPKTGTQEATPNEEAAPKDSPETAKKSPPAAPQPAPPAKTEPKSAAPKTPSKSEPGKQK